MPDSIPKRNTEIKNPGQLQEAFSEGSHSTAYKREHRKKKYFTRICWQDSAFIKLSCFCINCKNAHEVWIKADISLLYWPLLEDIQGINVFLKISNWPLIITQLEIWFSKNRSLAYSFPFFFFFQHFTSVSMKLHGIPDVLMIGWRKANLSKSIAWKWNIPKV